MLRLCTCSYTKNLGVLAARYYQLSHRLCTFVLCVHWRSWRTQRVYACCAINLLTTASGGVQMMEQRLNKPVCHHCFWGCSYRYDVAYHQDTTYQVTVASCIKHVNVFWLNGEVNCLVCGFGGNDAMRKGIFKLCRGVGPLYLSAHHFPLKSVVKESIRRK